MPCKAIVACRGARIETGGLSKSHVTLVLLMRVYRYFAPDSGLKTLQNRHFLLRDIRLFNDPFELLPRMNPPTEEEIVKALTSKKNIKLFHEQQGKKLGLDEHLLPQKF